MKTGTAQYRRATGKCARRSRFCRRSTQTCLLLSRLTTVLPSTASTLPDAQLAPRVFLTLALGLLSSLVARFVEWLAEEYTGSARVSVRCG
ncbi:hypothetical protein EDB87DRAFT_1645822 [Lactarius vividus]|nr:hypothetical protein EDB87DRAFT_1645822 [Lactarius vividus]